MKKILTIIVSGILFTNAFAQETEKVDSVTTINVSPAEIPDTIQHQVMGNTPTVQKTGDTTKIRLGNKGIIIVEKNGKTTVNIDNLDKKKGEDEVTEKEDKDEDSKGCEGKDENSNQEKHKKKHFEPHFAGVELFMNNYMGSNHSLSLPSNENYMELNAGKSMGVNVNIIEYEIPFASFTGLVTGLGFEFNSYYFDGDNNIKKDANGIVVEKLLPSPDASYVKTKFRDTYITIPLLYEIQIPDGHKNPFYISAGIIGGAKIGSSTKEIIKTNGQDHTEITNGGLNILAFRYGFQARMGYRFLNLFATYYPTGLFEKGKGPELYPFNVGLVLLSF